MDVFESLDPTLVDWVIIPALIFLARLIDVSLGTIRIVFVSKGEKVLAPILGFFEVLIWLLAIGQVMQNLNNFASYIGWAGGFAVGNYIGLLLEERLAIGQMVVRVITGRPAAELIAHMKKMGYRITCVDAYGHDGKVSLLFMIVRRKSLEKVINTVKQFHPKAFYTIEDVRSVSDLYSPEDAENPIPLYRRLFTVRKSK